jgi:hypothetical protein
MPYSRRLTGAVGDHRVARRQAAAERDAVVGDEGHRHRAPAGDTAIGHEHGGLVPVGLDDRGHRHVGEAAGTGRAGLDAHPCHEAADQPAARRRRVEGDLDGEQPAARVGGGRDLGHAPGERGPGAGVEHEPRGIAGAELHDLAVGHPGPHDVARAGGTEQEHRLARLHHLARLHRLAQYVGVARRHDGGVAAVELGSPGGGRGHGGLGAQGLELLLADHLVGAELLAAGEVARGLGGELPGLLHLGVDLGELEGGEDLALTHGVALADGDGADDAAHLEGQLQLLPGRDEAVGEDRRLGRTGGDGGGAHRGRRLRRRRRFAGAGREQDQNGNDGTAHHGPPAGSGTSPLPVA